MKSRPLTAWMIALINVAAICSIKNFPMMAEYGLATIFFLILASLFFFIPVSLVSAELATGWPDRGVYTWVKEGLSPSFGFLAIWLQWIENVIWYPTILSFIAATISYIFMPELAQNKIFVLSIVLATFWSATLINFLGMRISGWISAISVLFGTILPIGLILILAGIWLSRGLPRKRAHRQFRRQPLAGRVSERSGKSDQPRLGIDRRRLYGCDLLGSEHLPHNVEPGRQRGVAERLVALPWVGRPDCCRQRLLRIGELALRLGERRSDRPDCLARPRHECRSG